MSTNTERIDIDQPRWDQSTFIGRFKRFFNVANPLNGFHSDKELYQAKELVEAYRLYMVDYYFVNLLCFVTSLTIMYTLILLLITY